MKYLILFPIIFISFFSFSQKDTLTDDQLVYVFLEIQKTDQTHIKIQSIRNQIFESNLKKILSITKAQGFPSLTKKYLRYRKKTAILDGSIITFLHIFQTNPDLILNDSIIQLFKFEIEAGRLNKDYLSESLRMFIGGHLYMVGPIDDKLQTKIDYALKEWDMDLTKKTIHL